MSLSLSQKFHLLFIETKQIKNLLKKFFEMVSSSSLYVNSFRNDNYMNVIFLMYRLNDDMGNSNIFCHWGIFRRNMEQEIVTSWIDFETNPLFFISSKMIGIKDCRDAVSEKY